MKISKLDLRIDPEQKARAMLLARRQGLTLTDYVKGLLDAASEDYCAHPDDRGNYNPRCWGDTRHATRCKKAARAKHRTCLQHWEQEPPTYQWQNGETP